MTPMMPNSWAEMIPQMMQARQMQPAPVQGGQPPQNVGDGMQPNYLAAMLRARQQGFTPPSNGAPSPYQPVTTPAPLGTNFGVGSGATFNGHPVGYSGTGNSNNWTPVPPGAPQANSFLQRPVMRQF